MSSAFRSPAPGNSFFNTNLNRKNNGLVGNVMNSVSSAFNTATNAASNIASNISSNIMPNAAKNSSSFFSKMPSMTHMILMLLFAVIVILIGVFWRQIGDGLNTAYDKIRQAFGATPAPTPSLEEDKEDVTQTPESPQSNTVHEKRLVEKILPGRQEVFNISKNNYTYYDAEPLCKAMGAELATYEQVKQAYAKGADWCNYGWVKGQMAVYPTQTDTWEQLQQGSEDQRDACGTPGVNGGFFDNPELKFGVSCYGVKPEQKDHDATAIAQGQGSPLSPGQLDFEKKTSMFRGEANTIAILPFNKQTWSS
jgi:hypothetical protein